MRLPIVKQDGTEFENAEELSKLIQDAGDDLYLLTTQTWHGGIHISEDSAPWAKDTYPVRCIADGEVVAYRMMEDYLTSEFKGETLNYSNSFCLVRHHYEQEDDKGQKQGFTYYSLYMHLCPWKQWPSTERYRLNQRRNVRNSVPQNGQQAPAVTLPVGETFEPVEGEAIQQGQINGVAYDFMRIRMLSEGVSNSQVLATKGTDTLWIAKDEAVMEQISVSRPNWIYDQVEATVKEKMNGRADPKPNKGQTGFKLAGDPAHSISAGTKIRFDAHRVQFQEIGGKARKMARCELPESGRSQWVCIEEQYIDIISETPTQLDKLYELPSPVPIRAGDTIGYLGLYESPASLEGGKTDNAMIHLEVFSPEDDVEAVVNSKKWQDEGFRLVDGSDCDGVLDPGKVPDFFRSLCSPDEESKPAILDAEAVRERLTDSETAEERHKIVAKHNSEWWTPKSKAMMERFQEIYPSPGSLALIKHESKRVEKLSWMDQLANLKLNAVNWHLYPLSLFYFDEAKYNFSNKFETIKTIIRECKKQGLSQDEQIAYVLATVKRETGDTFRPVIEGNWLSEEYRRKNFSYYPYYGRGFVQITHKSNYKKYSDKLEIDLVGNPDLALDNKISLFILVDGFKNGIFTGAKLEDYVNSQTVDFINARRCINGLDHASEISTSAKNYLKKIQTGYYD